MIKNRKLLVLDLDETLIDTAYSLILNGKLKSHRGHFYLYERPNLQKFSDGCSAGPLYSGLVKVRRIHISFENFGQNTSYCNG